jgi:hypothetical protein
MESKARPKVRFLRMRLQDLKEQGYEFFPNSCVMAKEGLFLIDLIENLIRLLELRSEGDNQLIANIIDSFFYFDPRVMTPNSLLTLRKSKSKYENITDERVKVGLLNLYISIDLMLYFNANKQYLLTDFYRKSVCSNMHNLENNI